MGKDTYEDIIGLPHHQSAFRPHMDVSARAAQFSPFAALTGYEDVIAEAGRLTEPFHEIDETIKERLDGKIRILKEHIQETPETEITYYVPDEFKSGGAYLTATGKLVRADGSRIILANGNEQIEIDPARVIKIEAPLFEQFEKERGADGGWRYGE